MVSIRFQPVKVNFSLKSSEKKLLDAIDKAGVSWSSSFMAMSRVYPPPKPQASYRRTYTLHDSWTMAKGGRGTNEMWWEVRVTAIDPSGFHYTNKVIGDTQAPMHAATGWKKLSDQAAADEPRFAKLMQEALNKWAGS